MKKILNIAFSLIILLVFSCNSSDDQQEAQQQATCLPMNLQNGIVAFYPFINGSLNDESGNNYNLLNNTTASPSVDRDGNTDCAFNFNSSNNEFLEYNNPTFLDDLPVNNFSISFWYKADGDIGYAQFIQRDEGNSDCGYVGQWSISYIDEYFEFGVNGQLGNGHHIAFANWEHIVFTVVGTDLKLYKDGVLSAEEIDFFNCPSGNPTINQGDLFVGKFFDGKMDDIIIYDRELNSSEISELYNLSPCCS